RYGASLRKQVKKMDITQHARYTCTFCGKDSVKWTHVGIWHCKACKKTIARGAWNMSITGAATVQRFVSYLRIAVLRPACHTILQHHPASMRPCSSVEKHDSCRKSLLLLIFIFILILISQDEIQSMQCHISHPFSEGMWCPWLFLYVPSADPVGSEHAKYPRCP
ncbi:hypothetical protein M407DRAFT_72489, partial [Tulasnella calospora MUT 4182]